MTKASDVTDSADSWGEQREAAATPPPLPKISSTAAIQAQISEKTAEDAKLSAKQISGVDPDLAGDDDANEVLPAGLVESGQLVQVRQAAFERIPETKQHRRERNVAWKKLERAKRHWHTLQQGPTAPPGNAAAHQMRASEQELVLNGPPRREASLKAIAERITATVLVMDSPLVQVESEFPLELAPKDRLLQNPGIAQSLRHATVMLLTWAERKLKMFDQLEPGQRAKELTRELGETTSPDAIAKIQARLAAYRQAMETENIKLSFRRELNRDYLDHYTKAFDTFISQCLQALNVWREEARQAEVLWLEQFGLPHERTAVSRRYDECIATVQGLKANGAHKDSLIWFGVEKLPSLA